MMGVVLAAMLKNDESTISFIHKDSNATDNSNVKLRTNDSEITQTGIMFPNNNLFVIVFFGYCCYQIFHVCTK